MICEKPVSDRRIVVRGRPGDGCCFRIAVRYPSALTLCRVAFHLSPTCRQTAASWLTYAVFHLFEHTSPEAPRSTTEVVWEHKPQFIDNTQAAHAWHECDIDASFIEPLITMDFPERRRLLVRPYPGNGILKHVAEIQDAAVVQ
jgi:hypothetical protein